jgi:hypothetical protein
LGGGGALTRSERAPAPTPALCPCAACAVALSCSAVACASFVSTRLACNPAGAGRIARPLSSQCRSSMLSCTSHWAMKSAAMSCTIPSCKHEFHATCGKSLNIDFAFAG